MKQMPTFPKKDCQAGDLSSQITRVFTFLPHLSLLYNSCEFCYAYGSDLRGHIFLTRDGTMLLFILAKSTTHFQN